MPPLAEAMRMGGPHLVVYCFEPEDLAHATTSGRHLAFVQQGLADMDAQWAEWEARGADACRPAARRCTPRGLSRCSGPPDAALHV